MGYNLRIGEAEPHIEFEDRHARMGVTHVFSDVGEGFGAPLNSSSDHSNFCYPGYVTWRKFALETGLFSVFYAPQCPYSCAEKSSGHDPNCQCGGMSVWWIPGGLDSSQGKEGLLRNHCAALTEHHHTAFQEARTLWLQRPAPERVGEEGVDWVLSRLDWLIFWTHWALSTCDYPSFANH